MNSLRLILYYAVLIAACRPPTLTAIEATQELPLEGVEMPDIELPVFDLDQLENPLFEPATGDNKQEAGVTNDINLADDQERTQALSNPEKVAPEFEPELFDIKVSEEERRLYGVARQVAPAVLSLRAYDRFGVELARTAGFFISEGGHIATDVALIPEGIEADVAYITAIAGDRTTFRMRGVWARDFESGVLVLQADATNTPSLQFAKTFQVQREAPVYLVAFNEERGLLMADAKARFEREDSQDWLVITGENSSGDPGSPLLDTSGRVVGIIGMALRLDSWINFAMPLGGISVDSLRLRDDFVPIDRLGRLRRSGVLQNPRFLRAFQELYAGNWRKAAGMLKGLSKLYPRSAEVWGILGLAYQRGGVAAEARAAFAKASAIAPQAGSLWRGLAVSMLQSREPDDSRSLADVQRALESAVVERPGDRFAWFLLAKIHLARQEWHEADRALRQVVKIEPDFALGLFYLAYVRSKLSDFEHAESIVRRSLQLNKRNSEAWFLLGLLLTRKDELPEAIQSIERAVKISPNHPNAWANLSKLYSKTGNATKARLAMQKHAQTK